MHSHNPWVMLGSLIQFKFIRDILIDPGFKFLFLGLDASILKSYFAAFLPIESDMKLWAVGRFCEFNNFIKMNNKRSQVPLILHLFK